MEPRPVHLAPRVTGLIIVLALAQVLSPTRSVFAADEDEPEQRTPRYELQIDPFVGEESGARDVAAAVTLVGAGEERLDRLVAGVAAPPAPAPRAWPTALRAARAIVWDLPVAWWFGVALHEGFGHGGRARELDASPGIHLGSPWQGRVSYASFDPAGKSTEELLDIYAGGAEANGLAATLLERRAVEGVRMRPLDLFFLASNRLVASRYVLATTPDPRRDPDRFYGEYAGGGDVANYLVLLNMLSGGGPGITPSGADDRLLRQWRRLRRQAIWNGLDPGLWWALASALRMEARGDGSPALPLPRAGRLRYLPVFSSSFTPSGGETSLEWIAAPVPSARRAARDSVSGEPVPRITPGEGAGRRLPPWFSFVVRRGRGPAGPFGAIGGAADDLHETGRLTLGGAAEIWHDPRDGIGGGARFRARLVHGRFRGFYFDLGVKSQGYWVGQPAGAGPFGAFGVRYGD